MMLILERYKPPSFMWRDISLGVIVGLLSLVQTCSAYTALISDKDELRQSCSGMYGGKNSNIQALFSKGSQGTVATIFYEFQEFDKLGKGTRESDRFEFELKTYICTTQAVQEKLCDEKDIGKFIVDDSKGPATTVQRQRVDFGTSSEPVTLTYAVNKTGYYCLGATVVPLTSLEPNPSANRTIHAVFNGRVTFNNSFKGNLPASEYPKLNFYFIMTALYFALGLGWLFLCFRHRDEILTVQHFISGTIVFLIFEMFCQWAYYYYLNSHLVDLFRIQSVDGKSSVTAMARFLLVLSSIADATRNSVSFFLLLIVAMGYGVIRPYIGPVMTKVRLLTLAHFIFGVLYSIGIILIQIDQGGSWIFLFIFPLAVTLTSFLMWIMSSLSQSIQYLTTRKQTFKRSMFVKLHRILMGAVVSIFAFFIISSIALSQSGGEGFAPNTWKYRWFILDGSLGSLYFIVFAATAWVWRPTGNNMRLAMSDELATEDDPDAEGFEVDTFAHQGGDDSDDESKPTTKGRTAAAGRDATQASAEATRTTGQPRRSLDTEEVVFEIGDDEDDHVTRKHHRDAGGSETEETQGLMVSREENNSQDTLVPPSNKRADKDD